jgi:hypothetical protein
MFICVLAFVSVSIKAQEPTEYLFARVVPGSHISIERLTVSGPATGDVLAQIPIPNGLSLLDVELSATREQIALQFVQPLGPDAEITFLNLATFDTVNTSRFLVAANSPRRLIDTDAVFYWAPDARALAFIGASPNQSAPYETAVQSVDPTNGTIRRLSVGSGNPLLISWSPDSSQLAVLLASEGLKPPRIELYWFDSGALAGTVDLSPITNNLTDLADVCNLSWSPDTRYLTLVYSCAGGNPEISKRVYTINLQDNTVRQLADFSSNPRISGPIVDRFAVYDLQWLRDDLLISVDFVDGATRRTETWLYDLADQSGQKLADGFALDIAINPSDEQIVIPLEVGSVSDQTPIVGQEAFSRDNRSLSRQAFCHSEWDPEGRYFAASIQVRINLPARRCTADPSSILISDATGVVLVRLDVQRGERIIPLGWHDIN